MPELAPVFVNAERVRLQGDPQPIVRKIVNAAGRKPERTRVFRLETKEDTEGHPLELTETINRTETNDPVWLKCEENGSSGQALGRSESSAVSPGLPAGQRPPEGGPMDQAPQGPQPMPRSPSPTPGGVPPRGQATTPTKGKEERRTEPGTQPPAKKEGTGATESYETGRGETVPAKETEGTEENG